MKKNLILAESPLQLLNAYEVIQCLGLKHYTLLVRFSKKDKNDSQLSNVLNDLPFEQKNIIKLYLASSERKLIDYLKLIFIKILSLILVYRYKNVYSGNYDSKLFRLIINAFKRDSVYLLDDGNKSIRIQSEFSTKNYLNLFTMYDLEPFPGQVVIKNSYSAIRKLSNISSGEIDRVLFLGSGMSEIGIVTDDYYVELVRSIAQYYRNKGLNLAYVPHRAESEVKLERILLDNNIELIRLDYPIELYGMYLDFKPVTVSSFCSTAILTVQMIYGVAVECFHFDYEKTPDKEELDTIYKYYEECGVKIIRVQEYVA